MSEISDAARRAAVGHPLDGDERFLTTLSALLAGLPTMAGEYERVEAVKRAADDRMRSLRSGRDAEIAAARKEGAKAERERVKAILSCLEATGRERIAAQLAFSTDMAAEIARDAMRGLPKAEPPKVETGSAYRLRSHEAAGGLVTATEALVRSEPPRSTSTARDIWADVVAGVNREADGAAQPAPAVRQSAR
jgi:hypothetical protein